MNKKKVAALLCASLVMTTGPAGNFALSVAAAENDAGCNAETEENKVRSDTESGQEITVEEGESASSDNSASDLEDNNSEKNKDNSENSGNDTRQEEAVPSQEVTDEVQISAGSDDIEEDIRFITEAVEEAEKQSVPDMTSEVMKDFLTASGLYDDMALEAQKAVPPSVVQKIETIRQRIMDVNRTSGGVTADIGYWYIALHAEEATPEEIQAAVQLYQSGNPGSTVSMKYAVKLSYSDVRYGSECEPGKNLPLSFPVPEGYSQMKNPQIFTIADGKIILLTPEEGVNGNFHLEDGKDVQNIYIADISTSIQKIALDETASVNIGQKTTLKVTTMPEIITEGYELQWKSSDETVAQVDKNGQVTGKKQGTATITVSVKGNDKIQASCKMSVVQGANVLNKSADQVLSETISYVQALDTNPTRGSEWFVLSRARNGENLNSSYFSTYYNHFANYLQENKGVLTTTIKYTEYSKAILTMTAIGKDARNVAGYNLFDPLADFDNTVEQGPNGAIWALIALDSNPAYSFPTVKAGGNQNSREKLIDYLLSVQMPGGGWAMSGTKADSDLTGMALQALAPYYRKAGYENVTAAIDQALSVLSNMQNPTGGFSTVGTETVESCAQVLTGLCALGIDPEKDSRFIKGGNWMIANLLSYHIDNSGFMHVKSGSANNGGGEAGKVNGIATEQGFYSLVAYQRLKRGQTSLYNMSDIKLAAGAKGDGKGTGIVTPTPKPTAAKKTSSTKKNKKNKNSGDFSDSSKKSGKSGKTLNSTPGGKGKSLSGGSTGKSLSDKKSSSSDKNKKSSKGWGFEAEPYVDDKDKSKTTGETLTNATTESADSEPEETYQEEITAEQEPDRKWDGFPSAVWGFIGVCAGVFITKGPEQINKWRKRKKDE